MEDLRNHILDALSYSSAGCAYSDLDSRLAQIAFELKADNLMNHIEKIVKSTRTGAKAGVEYIADSKYIGSYQTIKGDKLYNRAYMINKIKEAYKKGYIDGSMDGKI